MATWKKGRKEDGTEHELKMESILQYIKAVMNLDALQLHGSRLKKQASGALPCVPGWKFAKTVKGSASGESYEDRARRSAQDGYTPEELMKTSMFYFNEEK